jgi:hypothetical protein
MRITYQGFEVELKLRTGFTVHNQDGTAAVLVHVDDVKIVSGPDGGPGGPGEPMPIDKAA